jgi:hypothetical protein
MFVQGSSDDTMHYENDIRALTLVQFHWHPTQWAGALLFDEAVKELLRVVLNEHIVYESKQANPLFVYPQGYNATTKNSSE